MTATNRHSVSVAAVITDDAGPVLVVQRRDNGTWEIPGGILELDESIHDGPPGKIPYPRWLYRKPLTADGDRATTGAAVKATG